MSKVCKTEKELAQELNNKADYIEIEGNLVQKTIRIKLVGKLAWATCATCLVAAIALFIATPTATVTTAPAGGAGGAISFTGGLAVASAATPVLGSATITAISIGVAAGGIGALNSLRDRYDIVEKRTGYIKLKRK